jgi:hypothetical protein
VPFEVRGSSEEIEKAHVEVVTCGLPMLAGFLAVGIAALAGAIVAARAGGVVGWSIAVVAALVAITGVGSFVAGVVGRYAGLPWLFTP